MTSAMVAAMATLSPGVARAIMKYRATNHTWSCQQMHARSQVVC